MDNTALKHANRATIRAAAEKELAEALKGVIGKLNTCLAYEDDHIMQHALVNLRGECEWCVKEFCR